MVFFKKIKNYYNLAFDENDVALDFENFIFNFSLYIIRKNHYE